MQQKQERSTLATEISQLPLAQSIPEAAKEIGLAPRTIRQKIRNGDIGHARFGRRIVIPRQALIEYVEKNTIRPSTIKETATRFLTKKKVGRV